ncbi:hypothetical protein [Brevundimonas goettingensis]|uniref:Uncharacterized protein n=1 Tax=Brevundimonas goettingensis TaxID=2774190 RepID=A0A975GUT1_9CAUL|nr:hypothetical protein [Brevundimonas goettingensis]QTC89813.1 hypothetical protein IFJ75_10900 [Brevundimonas goettingensis]
MRTVAHHQGWRSEGGGYALALVLIALAGVVVEMATGPLFFWFLPRQWLGIHVVLAGLWLIVWAISTRARPVPGWIALITLGVTVLPVIGWLVVVGV